MTSTFRAIGAGRTNSLTKTINFRSCTWLCVSHGSGFTRQQLAQVMSNRWGRVALRQPGSLRAQEFPGDTRIGFARPVNHDRYQEGRNHTQ